jgi:hypothetical protein
MHQTDPTEIFRERHFAPPRETEDRRLARRPRKACLKGRPRSERRLEESWLQILWSTGSVP